MKTTFKTHGHKIAIIDKKRSWSYDALYDAALHQSPLSKPPYLTVHPNVATIIQILGAFLREEPLFLISPKVPKKPLLHYPIPPKCATLMQTSGTTSEPKIACHTLENHLASARSFNAFFHLDSSVRYLLSLPLYHVSGLAILFRIFLAGGALIMPDDEKTRWDLITHVSFVPTQLKRFLQEKREAPRLKFMLIGGDKTPDKLLERAKHLPLHLSYGMTEMSSTIAVDDGTILPDREVKIADDGEILVRGPMLFRGYLGREQMQPGQFFPTGDLGRIEKGKLRILGRKDRQLISGGENIQPEVIEKLLLQIPGIEKAHVTAKDCPEYGKRPVAKITTSRSISQEEIHKNLLNHIPKWMLPEFTIVPK